MAIDGPRRQQKKKSGGGEILKDWLCTKNPLTKEADGDGSAAGLWIVFPTASAGLFPQPTSLATTGRHPLGGHS